MEYRDTAKDFLGLGWKFPVGVSPATGRLQGVSSEEDIAEAVRIILLTGKGERMMEPTFGCDIRKYLFAHMDYTTQTQLEQEVRDSLIRWEPRITEVNVQAEYGAADQVLLHIAYVVRATNNPYNLVYPYYLNEGQS
ncbi:MAG: GPW/gp25 family protein [Oscillospiraceae bacterium]